VSRTVDVQLRVTDNLLDLAVGLEVVEGFPGERTVDLETIDEGGNGDQAVGLNILLEAVVLLLVEDNSVLGLVLDCAACQWRFLQMTVGLGCARVGEGVGGRRAPERGGFRSEARRLGGYLCLCVYAACAHCGLTYPCPWTTSSSASCLRLLKVPGNYQSRLVLCVVGAGSIITYHFVDVVLC
jgi:hypothetical protein